VSVSPEAIVRMKQEQNNQLMHANLQSFVTHQQKIEKSKLLATKALNSQSQERS
jgi:hypothetical protein